MIRLHNMNEGIAQRMLARGGLETICHLQVAAGNAYRTGHPGAAASIMEIAAAAEQVLMQSQQMTPYD